MNNHLSGKKLDKKINDKGYETLFNHINITNKTDTSLVKELIKQLQITSLSVRKKFIYTDMLQRRANVVIVDHCKSSVDRVGTAIALGATNDYFLQEGNWPEGISLENLINSPEYKQVFFNHLCRAHRQTIPARFGIDETGKLTGKQRLGFKMYGSLLTESLPAEMVKETTWTKSKALRVFVSVIASAAYIIFFPVIIAFMLSVGHLLLGVTQICALAIKGKGSARRMNVFHMLPYSLTPWNIHNIAHKKLNHEHPAIKKYHIDLKA